MPAGTSQPGGVKDALLYGLAVKVAEHHQPDPNHPDRCANLRCAGETYPCTAARDAARAETLASAGPGAITAPGAPAGVEPEWQVHQQQADPVREKADSATDTSATTRAATTSRAA